MYLVRILTLLFCYLCYGQAGAMSSINGVWHGDAVIREYGYEPHLCKAAFDIRHSSDAFSYSAKFRCLTGTLYIESPEYKILGNKLLNTNTGVTSGLVNDLSITAHEAEETLSIATTGNSSYPRVYFTLDRQDIELYQADLSK